VLPDAQFPSAPETVPEREHLRLAPWWHTAIIVAGLLLVSFAGTSGEHLLTGTAENASRMPEYLGTIAWELLLVGFIWLGIRKRIRMRDLIGGRWRSAEDFFLDLVFAAAFWGCSLFVLGIGAKLMHLDQASKIQSMRKSLEFLAPGTNLELAVWIGVSIAAGLCEEVIFRGYLQRQFASFTSSMPIGIVLAAAMFGASHGYEGAARMVLIGVWGLMFGLLAWWRGSLRPGMMAHAWHDALSGALLRMPR
jgi:membrane protease YdiL (CAAX protease family)